MGHGPERNRAHGLETSFTIELPLDVRSGPAARRLKHLSEAERLDREALIDELTTEALRALAVMDDFEQRGTELATISKLAAHGEIELQRRISLRRGTPREAGNLLEEVFRARSSTIEARLRAARAGCTLLAVTKTHPMNWPRKVDSNVHKNGDNESIEEKRAKWRH